MINLIDKREFVKVTLVKNLETFVMYITALEAISIHSSPATQFVAWQQDKALTKMPSKYSDYADIFSFNLAIKLSKNTNINEYIINLIEDKQLPYKPIYTQSLVELEALKIQIVTYLKTEFI